MNTIATLKSMMRNGAANATTGVSALVHKPIVVM
jgi:hypothetical protein